MKTYATLRVLYDGYEIYNDKGIVISKTITSISYSPCDIARIFNEIVKKGWEVEFKIENLWFLISNKEYE